jgi:hypothetical protein
MFPPVATNITDGKPDGDPSPEARALCTLKSDDGPVLLFTLPSKKT